MMLAQDYLSPTLPTVSPALTAEAVQRLLHEQQLSQLPVVEDGELLGLVHNADVQKAKTPAQLLREMRYDLALGQFIYSTQHPYDAVSMMAHTGNAVVPVLGLDQKYLGGITRSELMRFFAEMAASTEPGGVVVLEMSRANYQLREIASIVESNNARALSVHLSPVPDSEQVYVTIKLNISELTMLILSFERYGYKVAYTFFDQKQLDDTQDRYAALMKFINI